MNFHTMLDWLVQAYESDAAFSAPIPFSSAKAAIVAGNSILCRQNHDRIHICHAVHVEVSLELQSPTEDIVRLAAELEEQARVATELVAQLIRVKSDGSKH